MKYLLTKHAQERMAERSIDINIIESALVDPTKIEYDGNGSCLIKKLFLKNNSPRLLLIAGKIENNQIKIFTVIETSKIKKYL